MMPCGEEERKQRVGMDHGMFVVFSLCEILGVGASLFCSSSFSAILLVHSLDETVALMWYCGYCLDATVLTNV